MTLFRHLTLPILLCATPAAAAPQFEQLDLLEARIVATLGAGIGEAGGPVRPIDRRLKLAACTNTPEIAVPTPASAVVRCGADGWRIYVPLIRSALAEAAQEKAEPMVRKGDQVELIASGGGFTVTTVAVAQQDGARGEFIRVRTGAKSAPVTAEVSALGQVVIGRFK